MNKPTSPQKRESGSALLMTLGVLSLLLIMAMAFAFTSRTERQVARSNSDQARALMLADSALDRVVAGMKYNFFNWSGTTPTSINYYLSVDSPSGFQFNVPTSFVADGTQGDSRTAFLVSNGGWNSTESAFTLGQILSDALQNNEDLKGLLNLSQPDVITALNASRFEAIEADGELIGRMGYLVLEASGKLNVNQLIFPNVRPPWIKRGTLDRIGIDITGFENSNTNSDFFFNVAGNGTWADLGNAPDEGNLTVRLGLHPSEMHLLAAYVTNLPVTTTTTPMQTFWTSYAHLNKRLAPAPNLHLYTFFGGEDEEIYPDSTQVTTGTAILSTFYPRFDLSGYSRSVATLPYYVNAAGVYTPNLANDGWTTPKMDIPTILSGIPAIAAMRAQDGSTDISEQVAANLIDYCDANNYATLPPGFGWTWGETINEPPAYCGNEKVPYINELHLEISGDYKVVAASPDDRICTLKITPKVEMFNIFGENLETGLVRVKLFGTVATTVTFDDASTLNLPDDPAYPLKEAAGLTFLQCDAGTSVSATAHDYTVLTIPSTPIAWTSTFAVPVGKIVSNVRHVVTITKAVVISGETTASLPLTVYDTAFWYDTTGLTLNVDVLDTVSPTTLYGSLEVSDCRCNNDLRIASVAAWTLPFIDDPTNHTLGADNNNLLLGDGTTSDQENTYFATNNTYSTAYIRNAPMQSLWELGAIHRAEPNCTINLRKFSQAVGTYSVGDALILDQVKIGPQTYMRGRLNPNARNPRMFRELFRGIASSDTYNAYSVYNASNVVAPPVATDWVIAPSPYRGALANMLATAPTYSGMFTNDREAEALIGRSAGLLSTRWEAFTLVTVGQALRELRDVTATAFTTLKDNNLVANPTEFTDGAVTRYCSILGTRIKLTHLLRDTWKNEFVIVQSRYLED